MAETIGNEDFQHFVAMSIFIFNLFSFFPSIRDQKQCFCVMAEEVHLSPLNGVYIFCFLEWAHKICHSEHQNIMTKKIQKKLFFFCFTSSFDHLGN